MSQPSNQSTVPPDRGQCRTIDLSGKAAQIASHWQPRVVAEMNDYQFKVVKVEGGFVWHRHAETDETFIVLEGELCIDFREGPGNDGSIVLHAGQMAVIPKGVEHRPRAEAEVKLFVSSRKP